MYNNILRRFTLANLRFVGVIKLKYLRHSDVSVAVKNKYIQGLAPYIILQSELCTSYLSHLVLLLIPAELTKNLMRIYMV